MTGGTVVVLGKTGNNFAAGMSGGVAYVLDEHHHLYKRLNKELVECTEVSEHEAYSVVKALIEEHVAATGSAKGQKILDDFKHYLPLFKKIIPHDYKKITTEIASLEQNGATPEQARIEAFYNIINDR